MNKKRVLLDYTDTQTQASVTRSLASYNLFRVIDILAKGNANLPGNCSAPMLICVCDLTSPITRAERYLRSFGRRENGQEQRS